MKTILKIILGWIVGIILGWMTIGILSIAVWDNLFITEPASVIIRIFIIVCMILMPLSD